MDKINEHVVKIAGSANSQEALNMGEDYAVSIEGTVTSITDSDNNDGTFNRIYRIKPKIILSMESKGKVIKTKVADKSPMHVKVRNRNWVWQQETGDDKHNYEFLANGLIRHMDEVMNFLIEKEQI